MTDFWQCVSLLFIGLYTILNEITTYRQQKQLDKQQKQLNRQDESLNDIIDELEWTTNKKPRHN